MDQIRRSALMIAVLAAGPWAATPACAGEISRGLMVKLSALDADQTIPVIITLARREDPVEVRRKAGSVGGMIRSLRDSITRRSDRIGRRIGTGWQSGSPRFFWINQTIAMTANRGLVGQLGRDPDIELIEEDAALYAAEPFQPSTPGQEPAAVGGQASAIPWNIAMTGVDSVWGSYGLDGSGVLIGLLDTGIDPGHPALSGKLRAGDAWKDILFGQPAPYDNLGHGTFGSGIIAGGNGGAGAIPGIGIAFGSRLIVCKMLDAGATSISQVTAAMQWILDPDGVPESDDYPRVVNNSWFSGTRGSTYAYAAAGAWRAAGIIPVFSAGNSGPASGTTRSPGDYKNTLSVGGTDALDGRYDATSVGPSPPDRNYFPADGRKPDLSAPGEGVYSSQKGGGYGTSSGTSWSAPHVAGIVALMLQANPGLDYDRVASILRRTSVDLGAEGYDHVFGYGRISAMGAVTEAIRARVRVLAEPVLHTSEPGGSAYFDMSLDVMPRDTVHLSFVSSDPGEGVVAPGTVSFTPADWFNPKRIYINGVDDDTADGDAGYAVAISAGSDDPLYHGIEPDSVRVVNEDDEGAIEVSVTLGWNLVSVPTAGDHFPRSAVFPASVSPAYGYDSGYVPGDTLRRGYGYWLRFGGPRVIGFPGDSAAVETVAVRSGWNLIGSISRPIASVDIIVDPPGIGASQFFGFDDGYAATDSIRPGRGYWVKITQPGILILSSGVNPAASRIGIIPTAEPPPPPVRTRFRR